MKRSRQSSTSTALVTKKAKAYKKKTIVPRNWFGARNYVKTPTGFPQRMRFTHKYVEAIDSAASAGSLRQYLFSCNGMYKPNITGTGHQPAYFDKMYAIYNHYTILRSKITVKVCVHTSTETADNMVIGICQSGTASPGFTNAPNMCEQPKSVYTLIDGDPGTSLLPLTLSLGYDAWKTFGSRVLSDSEQRGTSGTNPTEQNYFVLFFQDSNLSGNAQIDFLVTLEYEAIWTELKEELTN